MFSITNKLLFLLSFSYLTNINFARAAEESSPPIPQVSASSKPHEFVDTEKANSIARFDASFTFQVRHRDFSTFTIHFTFHRLPYEILSLCTKKLTEDAKTIVIEPIPWEEEPQELGQLKDIIKGHLLDPAAHAKMKTEMSQEQYQKLVAFCQKDLPKLFSDISFGKFEDFSPLAFCFFLSKLYDSEETINGMDDQIEKLAIKGGKVVTGLESFMEKMITLWPQAIQTLQESRGQWLTQDICWYLNKLAKEDPAKLPEEKSPDNPWNALYTNGNFFQLSYLSDQENSKADIDCVARRDEEWIPRIKDILKLPDRYPCSISFNVGQGHHGILGLLEKDGFEISIINKMGEAYSFSYTQSYAEFKKEMQIHAKALGE